MIVYVTRPDNHEVRMGGLRHVEVWVDKPYYSHVPTRRSDGTGKALIFKETGWRDQTMASSGMRFKALAEQDPVLLDKAWRLISWATIPRSEMVHLADTFEWLDKPLPGEDPQKEFYKTNGCSLLHHYGGQPIEANANVHHKRFLMQVNLVTRECQLLAPRVIFYDRDPQETLDIEEPFASRVYFDDPQYELHTIPF